jgi:hypothetical protein
MNSNMLVVIGGAAIAAVVVTVVADWMGVPYAGAVGGAFGGAFGGIVANRNTKAKSD